MAREAPRVLSMLRPVAIALTLCCSASVARATQANAARLLGPAASPRARRRYARQVVGNFFDFVVEIGQVQRLTVDALRSRIDWAQAEMGYRSARTVGTGAIILTAHIGSFETGLAVLTQAESKVHVVFKRDGMDGFEQIRRSLRQKLGVMEAPIDDGWPTWLALRDALEADEVVVMQGDRAWPGQKSVGITVCGAQLRVPVGPFKLAQLTGSPIVPVFTVRTADRRCRLVVDKPIRVDPGADLLRGQTAALTQWAAVLEAQIRACPEQWLVLQPAFVEDATDPHATL